MESYIEILEELVDSKRTSFYTENFLTIDLAIKKLLKRLKDLEHIEQKHKEINGQLRERVKELEDKNRALKKGVERLKHKKVILSNELIDVKVDKVTKNFIPKSKIKEKIEELDKEEQELQNTISDEEREEYSDASISWGLCDIETRRRVLQELLEE